MGTASASFLIMIVSLVASASAEDLGLFGPLPNPGKAWKLCGSGKSPGSALWNWTVLTNSQTGDVLSFASHKIAPGEPRELIYWSDTAGEIFPGGYSAWSADPPHVTVY